MRLGIDFGTTHTVAALVDRGNYPVVSYEWGDSVPSLVAVRASDGALKLGQDALELGPLRIELRLQEIHLITEPLREFRRRADRWVWEGGNPESASNWIRRSRRRCCGLTGTR